jgi:hypothetical protein
MFPNYRQSSENVPYFWLHPSFRPPRSTVDGAYAYTSAVWLPLAGAAFTAGVALYCRRKRGMTAVWPLLCVFAFTALCCLASVLSAAATCRRAEQQRDRHKGDG